MAKTIDKQVVSKHCPDCDVDFVVVRGSVYEHDEPLGLYLIGLHGDCPSHPLGHLAIAVRNPADSTAMPQAAAMRVESTQDQWQFKFTDWTSSPWKDEHYLGKMLPAAAVRTSPLRETFLEIAERVVGDLVEVQQFFD